MGYIASSVLNECFWARISLLTSVSNMRFCPGRAAAIVKGCLWEVASRCAAGFLPVLPVAVAEMVMFQQGDENWKKEMGK